MFFNIERKRGQVLAPAYFGDVVMIYKVKNSVDVYLIPKSDGVVRLQFYKINTRDRLTVEVSEEVSEVVSALDGKKSLEEIREEKKLVFDLSEANDFFMFLEKRGFITKDVGVEDSSLSEHEKAKYSRQVNFFDDYFNMGGEKAQEKLRESHVVVFGIGAVGGSISALIARAGIGKITIVDPKVVEVNNIERHEFVQKGDVGKYKVDVMSDHIKEINRDVLVIPLKKTLLPDSSLDEFFQSPVDLVINTADEPYIGHITLKLGRELWDKKIALYSAGGFDAHLMCTGEFVVPGVTPCADCYSSHFGKVLKGWKPRYVEQVSSSTKQKSRRKVTLENLGAGGMASQAYFSASYAGIQVISYLVESEKRSKKYNTRGEYLPNKGRMTWVEMAGNKDCKVCGGGV